MFLKESSNLKGFIGLILLSAFFFSAVPFFKEPTFQKRVHYIAPPKEIMFLSLGLKNQLSDLFWLRAIQDFDYCEQKVNQSDCIGKSWLFNVLDLIVDLDVKFLEAYFYGGLALTVLVNDYPGASVIFDKGVKEFPTEWELNYAAGYHSLIEEKDKAKAAKRYYAAAAHGAPEWVSVMAGRLAAEGNDLQFANEILENFKKITKNKVWIDRLQNKINEEMSRQKNSDQ